MTEQTSNHGWTIPTVDQTTDWGIVLNDFFDNALDRDVPLRDTKANRPAAGSSAPALFLATDENRLYYNDGSSWHEVAAGWSQSTVTSDVTAGNYDSIWVDASSAAVTVTLPTPVQSYRVAVTAVDATNTVTVARSGTESLNGSASDLTLVEGESVTLESDGTNWQVV